MDIEVVGYGHAAMVYTGGYFTDTVSGVIIGMNSRHWFEKRREGSDALPGNGAATLDRFLIPR